MIIVKLKGGLGNQMFQYALGRKLSLMHNTILKIDLSHYIKEQTKERTIRNYELDVFNISVQIANNEDILYVRGQRKLIFFRKIFNLYERFLPYYRKQTFLEQNNNFDENVFKCKKNCYLNGFWQSEKYFIDIRKILLNDFSSRIHINEKNIEIMKLMHTHNSVAIHIRRGDYIHNEHYKQVHVNLDKEYYLKAISLINKKVENPIFFFFSDDMVHVKKQYGQIKNSYFIDFNNDKNYLDLILMSNCKHNIIANSSFSWWGAWLNQNPGKFVIAPLLWYKRENLNSPDLVPDNWIKL